MIGGVSGGGAVGNPDAIGDDWLSSETKCENINWVGRLPFEEVIKYLEKCSVFVLPSYFKGNLYEVWGLVINEAMSMNLPVITTTAVGASYDMVINGYNGFVVKDNNVTALYRAMKNILNLDLVQMGMRSRQIFMEKNNFIRMANAFTR